MGPQQEYFMASIFATLKSIDQRQPTLELPLSLQAPELSLVDLATCPNVIEDARYDLELTIDLNELQAQLSAYHAALDAAKDLAEDEAPVPEESAALNGAPLSPGALLARRDLGISDDGDEFNELAEITTLGTQLYDSSAQQARTLLTPAGLFKGIARITVKINDQVNDKGYVEFQVNHDVLTAKFVADERNLGYNNQLFLMQYDTVTLSLTLTLKDRSELTLYSNFLLCASQHQSDNRNISQILTELTAIQDDTILELMFAQRTAHESLNTNLFGGHRAYQSLSSYVTLLEQVLSCYRANYNYFRTLARHMLVKSDIVTSFDQVRMMTQRSQQWLTQNLHVLSEVSPEQAALTYLGKNYLPMQMQSTINVKSFDTYENRVVVGFLQMVLHNASKIGQDYKAFLQEHLSSIKVLRAQLKERGLPYEAPIITLKFLQFQKCEQELNHLYELITDLNGLYRNYEQLFKLKDVLLRNFPRKAKAFQEIKPYAQVFHTINRWFRYGEFSLQKDMLFLQGKTLDKLFEYYCLYRLLDMLIGAGFTPIAGEAAFTFAYAHNKPMLEAPRMARPSSGPRVTLRRSFSTAFGSAANNTSGSAISSATSSAAPHRPWNPNANQGNAWVSPGQRSGYVRPYQRPQNQGVDVHSTRINPHSARFDPKQQVRNSQAARFDPRNNVRAYGPGSGSSGASYGSSYGTNASGNVGYAGNAGNAGSVGSAARTSGFSRRQPGMSVSANYHYDEPVANTYVLTRGKQKVTVYYQPVISTTAFYNQIFAFRTSGATSKGHYFDDNYYSPDFILKFSSGDSIPGDDDYVILDAKFARSSNVIEYYLEDLIKKYSTNTAIAVLRRTHVLQENEASDEGDELEQIQSTPIEGISGYELVATKTPRMIMALHGRVASDSTTGLRERASGGSSANNTEGKDAASAAPSERVRYWRYHNTPLARLIQPATNIGVLELSSNEQATKFLWNEIVKTLPYLAQSAKAQPSPAAPQAPDA